MHRPSHSPYPEQLKIFGEKYILYALESTTLNNVVIKIKFGLPSLTLSYSLGFMAGSRT
jgi:hypothetical protein